MDRLWFYTRGGSTEKQGPVSDSEIHEMVSSGAIRPQDLVWTDTMANWQPAGSVPELRSRMPSQGAVAAMPAGLTGWLGFVGVMNILGGVLCLPTCVGIVNGILMIVAGVALMGAKAALEGIATVDASLSPFFNKLRTFMQLTGIVYILGIIAFIALIVFWLSIFAAGLAAAGTAQ